MTDREYLLYYHNEQDYDGPSDWIKTKSDRWESHHEFIQWLFPTKTPSKFSDAPILDSSIENELTPQAKAIYIGNYYLFLQYFEEYGKLPFNHWILRASRVIESTQLCVSKFLPPNRVVEDICSRMSPENLNEFFKYHFQNRTGYEVLVGKFMAHRDMTRQVYEQSYLLRCLEAHDKGLNYIREHTYFAPIDINNISKFGIKVNIIKNTPKKYSFGLFAPFTVDCRW